MYNRYSKPLSPEGNIARDLFYSSYVQTYLQRDIRDLARVGDEMIILRFLMAAAARTGQLLNMAELLKNYRRNGRRAPFNFYRDKDQKEIGIIIMQDGTVYPLEFKKTAPPSKADVRHFCVLDRLNHFGYIPRSLLRMACSKLKGL